MPPQSIVFALANPDPEVDPRPAREHAAVVATGRSDQPNQINNVLAFPGVFRGMLDAGARAFTEEMALAAAIADAGAQFMVIRQNMQRGCASGRMIMVLDRPLRLVGVAAGGGIVHS